MRRAAALVVAILAAVSWAPREARGEEAEAGTGTDAGRCPEGGAPACPTYARYVNEKFAFSVDVPDFFVKKGADGDGRGQSFEYGKRAQARAWAMYNAGGPPGQPVMTLEQLYADWARRDGMTFKALAGNTWVVRGTERGKNYYSRSILADGIVTTIEVKYDPALADAFEPVLARMGATLMTLPGQGVRNKGD
jgi:hypothetical protein